MYLLHSEKGAHLKKTSGLLQNEKGKAEIQVQEETRVHNIAKQTKQLEHSKTCLVIFLYTV